MSALLRPQTLAPAALLAVGALAAGWWSAGAGSPMTTVQAVRANPPEVDKPGWQAVAAAGYLAAHPGLVPAAAQPAKPAVAKPAGPPPPDIAVTFRQDLSAVIGAGPSGLLMTSLGPAKPLRRGQVYRDRWRLASLTAEEAVLKRGAETRRIALFAPASQPAPTPLQIVVLPSAQQRPGQRPAAPGAAPVAANGAQPTPAPQNQGGRGGRFAGGGGRGRFGGQGFGGQGFGGQGFGGANQAPPAPATPTPPIVIVPGGAPASTPAAAAPAARAAQ